jgi:hypothetical protein
MRVRELIQKLQEEDPESFVIAIASKDRYTRLGELKWVNEVEVGGRSTNGPHAFTVLILKQQEKY